MPQNTHVQHAPTDLVSDASRLLDLGGLAVDRIESDAFGGRVVHLVTIQEIYAHLLVFYAIRALINQVAEPTQLDPDRLSFIRTLRVIHRQVTDQGACSPKRLAVALIEATAEILACLNKRRLRVNPRVIKRKMSKRPLKRAGHRDTPQPQAPPADTITITITSPSRTGPRNDGPSPRIRAPTLIKWHCV